MNLAQQIGLVVACGLHAACAASPSAPSVKNDSQPSVSDKDSGSDASKPAPADGGAGLRDAGPSSPDPEDSSAPNAAARGLWLKGDFHVHSKHSTDAADSPVEDVIARAHEVGFDFFVITDHDNHVQGKLTTWADPAYHSERMALLYGVEWTTGKGHANIFGSAPFEYAPIWDIREGEGAPSIAAAHAQGLHFSVNHPAAKDLWELGFELDYDSMEVWTAVFLVPNSNDKAIGIWDGLLSEGRRITARGGSDSHHQHDAESLLFNIGNPTTWVYAKEKTGAAVLEALKAGHVSLSYAPAAERIDFVADGDADGTFETLVGDNLAAGRGKKLRFKIEIVGFRAGASYDVKVLKNGSELMALSLTEPIATFEDTPLASTRSYYRVEVRGDTPKAPLVSSAGFGGFVALTNPIYVGYP